MRSFLAAICAFCAATACAQELPGLVVRASDGSRTVSFVTPTVSFTLQPEQSLHAQLKPAFEAEWSGFIKILQAGRYTFRADGVVLLDGKEVQNRATDLPAGNAQLRVKYSRKPGGPARLQLQWQSEHFPLEPVPGRVLYHTARAQELGLSERLASGRALIEEYNCTACHASDKGVVRSRRAPDLTFVGSRTATNWIYKWLENPQHFRASATMPRMLHTVEERADVAAYLGGLKSPQTRPAPLAKVDHGQSLFNTVGCAACHGTNDVSLAGIGSKYSAASLADYLMDPLAVDPSGRMPNMLLARAEADALAAYLIHSENKDFEAPAPMGNPERGRTLVVERGCVNCHRLKDMQPKLAGPTLRELAPEKGCVAESPPRSVPHFAFDREQRGSINAWLRQQDVSEAPADDVFRIVKSLNCGACHEYYRPPDLNLDANQGPPPLSEAGYKLRRSWLDAVLNGKKRIRPWMGLRMPQYGSNNVHRLVDYLHAQAGSELGEGDKIPQPSPAEVQAGVHLLGRAEGALSCINCHDFRGEPSGGEMRGPDMTEMYARIRVDWLRRFLHEPQRILPGTSMPAFFSGLPSDQAEAQITKIIQGLAVGKDMPIPPGLTEAARPFYLLVRDEPIVFRTFIEGSSPRSIAVGFPGLNSFVFDAQLCRLRYAWTGDFLDVKPVWADRGGQQAKILGKRYYTAPDTSPIRVSDAEKAPQVKFRGYKLVNKIPEFMYEVDGVRVTERITPANEGLGLVRQFTVSEDAWFVAGQKSRIKAGETFEVKMAK